ncbi:MAG TPA: lysine--tRNA ligase [Holophagaceae bacterium]|nr:lysine--tRNA ligase [Holophagaceae bacterium]
METNQYRQVREEKLRKLAELGVETYPRKAARSHSAEQVLKAFGERTAEELEAAPQQVSVMGRIIALRDQGKTAFLHLTENGEKLQAYLRKDAVPERDWEIVKLLDLGDFISVTGTLMRTRTGELTVKAEGVQFLTKALLPLPEKWHGLQDKELRYRQRYLDLVSNPEVLHTFRKRSQILSAVRRFMEGSGYLEVETPMMQPIPGGATARPFTTHHNALDMPLYLRIAPELYLKRLIVGGFEKVFEINRNFRNEGLSVRHNPEFTMMEWYAAGEDLRDMMAITEALISTVAREVMGAEELPWGEQLINYKAPFRRLTLKDAIAEYGAIDRHQLEDDASIRTLAKRVHIEDADKKSPGVLLGDLFEHHAEKQLVQPTFITDYPIELSPLTKTLPGDDRFVDRFELFIGGMEIANAYSELNDPIEQLGRFQAQMQEREAGNDEAMLLDQDFVNALEHGFPPTGGEGLGIDRLVMLLTNSISIRDVILFPLMRPQGARSEAAEANATEEGAG